MGLKGECMRTEYDFTEAQKAGLRRIDDEIEQLNRQIFDLCMEREHIYMQVRCRYIFDTEEYVTRLKERARLIGLPSQPLIPHDAIVKMIFEKE